MRIKARIIITLLGLLPLSWSCRRDGAGGVERWRGWFDDNAQRLPKTQPQAPLPDWLPVRSPDGLVVRLSSEYLKRNDYGCWARAQERWPGPGWRDICVHLLEPAANPVGYSLKPVPPVPGIADRHVFDAWRVETFTIGNRRAVVERARGTGGIEGANKERMLVAIVELPRGGWARISARTGDDPGYDELISIASTVERSLP